MFNHKLKEIIPSKGWLLLPIVVISFMGYRYRSTPQSSSAPMDPVMESSGKNNVIPSLNIDNWSVTMPTPDLNRKSKDQSYSIQAVKHPYDPFDLQKTQSPNATCDFHSVMANIVDKTCQNPSYFDLELSSRCQINHKTREEILSVLLHPQTKSKWISIVGDSLTRDAFGGIVATFAGGLMSAAKLKDHTTRDDPTAICCRNATCTFERWKYGHSPTTAEYAHAKLSAGNMKFCFTWQRGKKPECSRNFSFANCSWKMLISMMSSSSELCNIKRSMDLENLMYYIGIQDYI